MSAVSPLGPVVTRSVRGWRGTERADKVRIRTDRPRGVKMLKVYGFSRVNKMARGNTRDLRVLWALEEMGLPYEIVGMDHPNHDLDREEFRAKNPFGQLPVIDDDGVVVSESGAILIYLARKSGKLIPSDLAGEAQVLRWSFAALCSVEVPVLAKWFVGISGGQGTKPHEALNHWADMRLKQLDGWLASRAFVATDEFTVADILMTHVLSTGITDPALLEPCPNVRAYLARCTGRPAWERTLDAYLARVQPG
jgi:glutathione S-transferase